MDAVVQTQVDQLRRPRDPCDQRVDQPLLLRDNRVDGAVMIGVGMNVEKAAPVTERLADRRDDGRIPSLGHVGDGFEQRHGSTLRFQNRGFRIVTSELPLLPLSRRYVSIRSLQRDLVSCRRCAAAGFPIESAPVVQGAAGRRAYLYGQAPGIVEGAEGAPWRGRAGRTLRRWLELDDETFDATFYCASVTRCYPGRVKGRGDRTPTPAERSLCSTWRFEELRLLRPALVITVGALAARAIIGARTLGECVGKSYVVDDAIAIPLPHPSGASAWLNEPVNRARLGKALTHARRELRRLAEPS